MPDVLTPEQRHLNMSRIRAKNTKPEMLLRRGLHGRGFRYQLHRRELAGCPDLVFPRYRAVIFVHGCFWHGHDCHLFKLPETRREFWEKKILRNRERDKESVEMLRHDGWRILIVWECALRGVGGLSFSKVLNRVGGFLVGKRPLVEIAEA
jgi:DNA mismatch endonuclease (patch repair protein)